MPKVGYGEILPNTPPCTCVCMHVILTNTTCYPTDK